MPTLFHMKSKFSSRTKSFTKHLISFSFHKTAKIKENHYIFQRGKRSNFINMHFALQIIITTLNFKPTAVKCIPLFSFRRRQKKVIRCEICNCIFFFVSLWSSNCGSKRLANKFVMIKKARLPNGERKKIRNKPCSNLKPSFITSETTKWKKHRSKVLI